MRASSLFAAAFLAVAPTAFGQSSSISEKDSSTIEIERRNREAAAAETGVAKEPGRGVEEAVAAGDWAQALNLVRRELEAAEAGSEERELRLLEARLVSRLGNDRSAIRIYRRLLDEQDVGAKARAELHDLYVLRGQFDAADRLTEAAAEPGLGADPELAKLRAFSRSTQGRFAEAARLAGEAATRGDPEAQVLRANALLALGSLEAAEELYLRVLREALARNPRQVAHFGLGQVARIRGARAVRALQDERAVRLGPAPWAELDWGLSLRALGRKEEARARLEGVVTSYPELASTARLALARLDEEEGRADDGIEHLVDALEGGTGDFLVLTRLGELLIQEGKEEPGVEAHRAALVLFPEFPTAKAMLTRALTSRGRWDEVPDPPEGSEWILPGWTWDRMLDGDLAYFPIVAETDSVPRDDTRRFVLALLHLRAGNAAAALAWTRGASPENARLATLRAEALEQAGRGDEAEELWEAILAAGAGGPVARERLAHLVFERDPDRAETLWRELFARYPDFPRARIRRARALEGADRLEDALAAYRDAEGAGWFSAKERRRIRVAIEDLQDLLLEREEAAVDVEG